MLRTRDYFLLLVVIVFLLVAIGTTTITHNWAAVENNNTEVTFVSDTPTEFSAVVAGDMKTERTERLFALREKIQSDTNLSLYEQPEPEEQPVEEVLTSEDALNLTQEIQCSGYTNTTPVWSPTGLKVEEIEGLRLVYRENAPPAQLGSSSTIAIAPSKDILLKLPVRSISQGARNCLPSVVIGITLRGSLIKNTDATLYAPFSEETILGYALDGYPIYGTSAAPTDACGGRNVSGQYRYQLSSERETILNCYSGTPVKI